MELETSKVDCVRQQKLVDKYKGDSLKYEKAMMKSMNKESDQNKIISSLKLRMDDFISQQQRTEARLNAEISSLKKYKISKKIENLMIGDDFGQDTDISGSQHDADYIRALERSLRSISRDLETKNETNRILRVKIERFERSINVSSERKSFDLFLNSLETSNEKDDDPEVTLIDEFPVSDSTVKMSPIKINDEVISIKNRKIEPPPKFFNRKYRKIVS